MNRNRDLEGILPEKGGNENILNLELTIEWFYIQHIISGAGL